MKYLISIAYDGSKFHGFQRLKQEETVQKKLEESLSIINKKPVTIKGAGRTDKGVHAIDQKASFALDINISPNNLKKALNNLVKPYIFITNVELVDNAFHARFNVLKKEYVYKINLGDYSPLTFDYIYTPVYPIDLKKMETTSKIFIGTHNFKNFVAGTRPSYESTIENIEFTKQNNILEIKFTGIGFYRYMVRNLVGAMLDVARGNVTLEEVKKALDNPEIKKQFKTANPQGLYLNKIYY